LELLELDFIDFLEPDFFEPDFLELDVFLESARILPILTKSWGLKIGAFCVDLTFVGKLIIKLYNNVI